MKIRELLSSPDKWIKMHLALDANGKPCMPRDSCAVQWCLSGARARCYGYIDEPPSESSKIANMLHRAVVQRGYASVGHFNDNNDFEAIKALVDALDI